MSSLLDVCKFIPTAGGTTDWTYASAVGGYQSPASAGAKNAATYSYRAESSDLTQWEVGTGVWNTSTGVLSRAAVLFNSAGTTAKIGFTSAPSVSIVALAEDVGGLTTSNVWTGNQYFKGGTPWFDVRAFGAAGDGSADDTTAINNAITAAGTTGTVFLPAGSYKVTSTITVPNSVRIVGSGIWATTIGMVGDHIVLDFTGNGHLLDIFISGYQNAAATNYCVRTAANATNIFRDCYIWGGFYGLQSRGTDGCFENCFIAGSASGGGHLFSTGANWYIRCKFDDIGFNVSWGAAITITGSPGLMENHFSQCDFSGSFTNGSLTIDDGTSTNLITGFESCVLSSNSSVTHARATQFTGCEFGASFTVSNNCIAIFVGNYALTSITITGTNVVKSGNFNIT